MITYGSNIMEMVAEFFCSGEIWDEVNHKVSYSMDLIWHGLEDDL